MHRHRPTMLPHTRIGVCLQSTTAAAATDQLNYPDSSRLVRRPDSGSVRAAFPPGCQYYAGGARDLVRVVPEKRSDELFLSRQATLRRVLGSGSGQRRDCCGRSAVSAAFSGLIFTHRPYLPRLFGNFLCRVVWLSL